MQCTVKILIIANTSHQGYRSLPHIDIHNDTLLLQKRSHQQNVVLNAGKRLYKGMFLIPVFSHSDEGLKDIGSLSSGIRSLGLKGMTPAVLKPLITFLIDIPLIHALKIFH